MEEEINPQNRLVPEVKIVPGAKENLIKRYLLYFINYPIRIWSFWHQKRLCNKSMIHMTIFRTDGKVQSRNPEPNREKYKRVLDFILPWKSSPK